MNIFFQTLCFSQLLDFLCNLAIQKRSDVCVEVYNRDYLDSIKKLESIAATPFKYNCAKEIRNT